MNTVYQPPLQFFLIQKNSAVYAADDDQEDRCLRFLLLIHVC